MGYGSSPPRVAWRRLICCPRQIGPNFAVLLDRVTPLTKAVPLTWSESENIAWKTPLPGRGWSSPVIAGNEVWLTTSQERGRSLHAISLDADTGQVRHDVEVFRFTRPPSIHPKNSYASPTPIIEGEHVYVHFGTLGTAALTRDGEVVWKNQQLRYQHGHGPGGSPALSGDLLVVNCDGTDVQYVAALDKNTGRIRWQTRRPNARMAFSTPLVIDAGDSRQVVSTGGDRAGSYDLETGEELWWIRFDGFSAVPRPVFGHGLVYLTSGFYNQTLFAVRPDGRGDVTSSHIAWRSGRGVPLTPSPSAGGRGDIFHQRPRRRDVFGRQDGAAALAGAA